MTWISKLRKCKIKLTYQTWFTTLKNVWNPQPVSVSSWTDPCPTVPYPGSYCNETPTTNKKWYNISQKQNQYTHSNAHYFDLALALTLAWQQKHKVVSITRNSTATKRCTNGHFMWIVILLRSSWYPKSTYYKSLYLSNIGTKCLRVSAYK